jgi:hypothetical protein
VGAESGTKPIGSSLQSRKKLNYVNKWQISEARSVNLTQHDLDVTKYYEPNKGLREDFTSTKSYLSVRKLPVQSQKRIYQNLVERLKESHFQATFKQNLEVHLPA